GSVDREFQRGTRLVPDAAVIGRGDPEAVRAGTEIGIERLPPRADVLPVAIAPFELDAEAVLLRRDEAQRRVVDLQVAPARRQAQALSRIVRRTVGGDLLDVHGGR